VLASTPAPPPDNPQLHKIRRERESQCGMLPDWPQRWRAIAREYSHATEGSACQRLKMA
jgi:hypothetical protein